MTVVTKQIGEAVKSPFGSYYPCLFPIDLLVTVYTLYRAKPPSYFPIRCSAESSLPNAMHVFLGLVSLYIRALFSSFGKIVVFIHMGFCKPHLFVSHRVDSDTCF